MSLPFPHHPFLTGSFAPILFEADATICLSLGRCQRICAARFTETAQIRNSHHAMITIIGLSATAWSTPSASMTAYRRAENRSDLAIFNCATLADGPIALAELSHLVTLGFHGNWLGPA